MGDPFLGFLGVGAMVDALLVVAIALGVLCFRRLGALLVRGEETHIYLEARLEDRIRSGMKEIARSVQEETAASVTSLSDWLLAELAQNRLALEQRLEALAKQVVESSRSRGDALEAIGRQTSEEAQRTRRELVGALGSLQRSLSEALGEMRALHEQAVRELRRPIQHAVAIRQEIRRARDQHAKPTLEPPAGRSEVADAARMDDALDRILGPEMEGEDPPEPTQAQPPVTAPRRRRLAGLLSRVQRRVQHADSARADTHEGH